MSWALLRLLPGSTDDKVSLYPAEYFHEFRESLRLACKYSQLHAQQQLLCCLFSLGGDFDSPLVEGDSRINLLCEKYLGNSVSGQCRRDASAVPYSYYLLVP